MGGTVYEPLTGLDYEAGMRIPYLSEYVETWAYGGAIITGGANRGIWTASAGGSR